MHIVVLLEPVPDTTGVERPGSAMRRHRAARPAIIDPAAPLGEHADLFVVGDLFDVGPALVAETAARRA